MNITLLDFVPEGSPLDYFQHVHNALASLAPNARPHQIQYAGCIRGDLDTLRTAIHLHNQDQKLVVLLSPNPLSPQDLLTPTDTPQQLAFIAPNIPPLNPNPSNYLAYQSYYVAPQTLQQLLHQNAGMLRLGLLRQDIEQAEPLLRDCQATFFALSAIRVSDAPHISPAQPIGLFAEEACRLVRYATLSDRMQLLAISDYRPDANSNNTTALLIAQMIWFAIDGALHRMHDYPTIPQQLRQHIVLLKEIEQPCYFFHNPRSERWWFAFSDWQNTPQDQHNPHLLPCHYQDYQLAQQGELSERLWRFITQ